MAKKGPTQEEFDCLIYKLATLKSELGLARKMLEAASSLLQPGGDPHSEVVCLWYRSQIADEMGPNE